MQQETERRRTRRKWPFIAVVVLLSLLVICGGVLWASYHRYLSLPDTLQAQVDLLPDVNAREGTPSAVNAEPVGAESFQIVINQYPTMETGKSPCNIEAENPDGNHYDLRVCLYLQSTGELLGATHRIERGKRVDEIMLDTVLPAGEYAVLARLELFDDSQEPAGQIGVDLTLRVLG